MSFVIKTWAAWVNQDFSLVHSPHGRGRHGELLANIGHDMRVISDEISAARQALAKATKNAGEPSAKELSSGTVSVGSGRMGYLNR